MVQVSWADGVRACIFVYSLYAAVTIRLYAVHTYGARARVHLQIELPTANEDELFAAHILDF